MELTNEKQCERLSYYGTKEKQCERLSYYGTIGRDCHIYKTNETGCNVHETNGTSERDCIFIASMITIVSVKFTLSDGDFMKN